MEKIVYIILLIILESDFYNDIKTIIPNRYDFLVNKNYKLKEDYIPNDLEKINLEYACDNKYLRHEARINFEKMTKQAKLEGYNIIAVSTYRSYDYQYKLYNNYVKE